MVTSYMGVPIKNMITIESAPMKKQEKYTQECLIKILSETSLD